MAEVVKDELPTVDAAKVTLQDLYDDVVKDYKAEGKASLPDVESRWKLHIKPFFGTTRKAKHLNGSNLLNYKAHRKTQGSSSATINREFSILRRMFNLGRSTGKTQRIVEFKEFFLKETNKRTGFVEDDEYQKLAEYFAGIGLWVRAIFETAFVFGMRVTSILNLKVGQVNLYTKKITLYTGQTKNDEPLAVAIPNTLFQLLKQCCEGKKKDDWLFTRPNGKRVKDFRGVWENACEFAGHPERLFHDTRRTAVRNLVRAGIPEKQAQLISQHKTRSVFDRYNISTEKDLDLAMGKLEIDQKNRFGQKDGQNEAQQPVPEPQPVRPN